MQITLVYNENLVTLPVTQTTTLQQLIESIQNESQLRSNTTCNTTLQLQYAGSIITVPQNYSKTLQQLNIQDNDVIQVYYISNQQQSSSHPTQQRPQQQMSSQQEATMLQMAMLEAALEDDPMNPELQRQLEHMIQQKNINDNLEQAYEMSPESFARVVMLYIPMEINNKQTVAFVDSGAQSTIMSYDMAKQCNLDHLIDKRFSGMAIGVGTQKIIGRVHLAKIRIGDAVLVCSFTILEHSSIDILLGLDQLKKHQMCINLQQNVLELYDVKVPFLPEYQIPGKIRQSDRGEDSSLNTNNTNATSSNTNASSTATTSSLAGNPNATSRITPPNNPKQAAIQAASQQTPASTQQQTRQSTTQSNVPQLTPQTQAALLAALLQGANQVQQQQQQSTNQPATTQQTHTNTNRNTNTPYNTGTSTNHSIDKIQQLTQFGFTQSEAIQALNATNGDVEQAAALLFSTR